MDINTIKYFITLAEYLHFGRAAEQLYISQSSLSYHIQQLENELGTKLFIRDKRKVLLTSNGAKLLPQAKKLLEDSEKLIQYASDTNENTNPDHLNIAFDNSFERYELLGISNALINLRKNHPGLKTQSYIVDYAELVSGTESMKYDLGIATLRNKENMGSTLNCLPLFTDTFAIAYYTPKLEDMSDLDILLKERIFLVSEDDRWTGYIKNWLINLGVKNPPILVDKFGDIYTHLCLGEGVTILPFLQLQVDALTRPGLVVREIKNIDFNMVLSAVWAKGNYNYAITNFLGEIVIDGTIKNQLW